MTTNRLPAIALAIVVALVGCVSEASTVETPTAAATNTPWVVETPTTVATDTLPAATDTPVAAETPTVAATDAPPAGETPTTVATNTPLAVTPAPWPCELSPVIAPTPPAVRPIYAGLDPDTGLHVTGSAEPIDQESYRLEVTGRVDHPLSLTYDDLRCMSKVEARVTLVCPGYFVDEATWAGVPIREVLELAGVQEEAAGLKLIGADGYARTVPLDEKLLETAYLAYEWEGEPLPALHGFPVRVVIPDYVGGAWVKWLVEIEVSRTKPVIPWDLE